MYKILDRETVCDYVRSIPAVVEVLGDASRLDVEEIGNGNLNFVYRIRSGADPSRSIIVKQAVPYLRMVGESWPLDRERMTYEIRALTAYNDLVPGLVPKIHHADEAMSVLIMQCLDSHIILREGMIGGVRYPKIAEHIGRFLADTLFRTSSLGMESQARRALMHQFTLNSELCKLTEEFIFTFPYMEHSSNYSNPATDEWARAHVRNDAAYKAGVLKFKELFLTKADALLHADLHIGSLMVNADESYVIDMEFAYFGPYGFDVGKIIANFLMCATSHLHRSPDRAYLDWLVDQAMHIWRVFERRFLELWDGTTESAMLIPGLLGADELAAYKRNTLTRILQDSVGFAACSIARRTLGIAGVADVRGIEDLAVRSRLEVINLELSKALMAAHESITSLDALDRLVRDFYRSKPHVE